MTIGPIFVEFCEITWDIMGLGNQVNVNKHVDFEPGILFSIE